MVRFCEGLWLHLHISVVLWGIVITFAHFCCFVIYVYKKELEVPRYGKNVRTWTLWIVEWINSLTSTLITSLLICQTMERFFSNFLLAIRYEAKSNSIWGEGARSSETYGAQPKPPKAPILNTIFLLVIYTNLHLCFTYKAPQTCRRRYVSTSTI